MIATRYPGGSVSCHSWYPGIANPPKVQTVATGRASDAASDDAEQARAARADTVGVAVEVGGVARGVEAMSVAILRRSCQHRA